MNLDLFTIDGLGHYLSDPRVLAAFGGLLAILALSGLVIYLLSSYFLMRVFNKAGVANSWLAFIPIANTWQMIKLGGYPGWIALAFFVSWIPFVGWLVALAPFVFSCIAAYNVALKLNKSGALVILYIFLPIVFNGICGLDKSQWDDSQGNPVYSK